MTKNLPTRQHSVTPVGKYADRYRWALAGPSGVVELVAVDVFSLGRAYADHLDMHSLRPWADAEDFGECPELGGEMGHCAKYNLAGDKLAREWSRERDDTVVWAALGELYGELPAADAPAVTA